MRTTYPTSFYDTQDMWVGAQTMKLLITQFSPFPCHFHASHVKKISSAPHSTPPPRVHTALKAV